MDLPGTGRISFRCSTVFDAAGRGRPGLGMLHLDVRRNRGLVRTAVALHEAVDDTRGPDLADSPVLPRFYWAFRADRAPAFSDRFAPGVWHGAEVTIGEFRAWPAEMFVRPTGDGPEPDAIPDQVHVDNYGRPGARSTLAGGPGRVRMEGTGGPIASDRRPAAIFAKIDHLLGRSVRNPAYTVLRRLGLVPREGTYLDWRVTVTSSSPGRHRGRGLEADATENLRERTVTFATSGPTAQADLLAETRAGCEAAGIAVPSDDEAAVQFLAGLVMSPWSRPEIRGAGLVQVIRTPAGPGQDGLLFSDGVVDLDLGDLGGHGAAYEALDRASIDLLLRRRPGMPFAASSAYSASRH